MKKETQFRLTWIGATACFLLYAFFDFAFRLTSASVYLEKPFQIELGGDIFGNQYLSQMIAEWLSAQYSNSLHSDITASVGATIASGVRMIFVSLLAVFFAKRLTGRSIPIGAFNKEAWLWIAAFVLGTTLTHYLFSSIASGSLLSLRTLLDPDCNLVSIQGDIEVPYLFILLQLFSFAIIAPITEEINNRGFLVNALLAFRSLLPAAMISAAMFAFLHGDLSVLWFYYFMSGLALFAARFRFNGLLVPILMHMAANGTLVANALYNC